ncbi:hypothetical protein [Fimbriiglobus ruber]|uniref:Uncharacterized protein n=1 Tax=Fimbriiglobus ruber TaxID=1908690 RepID=A0A225E657_9BACT|nr:hypothetical protein [Fimbriiglobus ruber]OWK43907.1 hypothetical protein FRUB_03506 [Fimbriiglobus ruber]
MPTITIPDDAYQRLSHRASSLGISTDTLVAHLLERGDQGPIPPGDLPYDQWKQRFDELLANAASRAHRYPPGFQADVSRESIYEGRGE